MNDKYNELQAKVLHYMAMARENIEIAIACNIEITNLQGKGLKLVDPVTPETDFLSFEERDIYEIAEERIKAITPDTKFLTHEEIFKKHLGIYGLPPKGEK